MKHKVKGRKFHREKGQRNALLKILANNLIVREKIETTDAKAKEIRPIVEKLITLAKKNNLESFRILLSRLPRKAAQKIFYDLAPRYKDRKGGYLRIIKGTKPRRKDATITSIIEFIK